MHEVKPTGSSTNYVGISNSKELEFGDFDESLLENLPRYEPDSVSPRIYFDTKARILADN